MTRLVRVLGIATMLSAGWQAPAPAQSHQPLSLEVSGAGNFAMDPKPTFDPQSRPAFEAQGRYTFSRFSLGVGAVIQSPLNNLHWLRGSAFVEPRLILAVHSGKAVYVSGRVGYGRFICTTVCTNEGMHVTYGGGGGLLVRLSPRIAADLGAQYFRVIQWSASGYTLLRAGLTLGL